MSQQQISQSNIIEQIHNWLFNKIAQKHKKIGNYPICPYLNKYKNKIHIVETDNPFETAQVFVDIGRVVNVEAVVMYIGDIEFEELVELKDNIQNEFVNKDLTVLAMHPDTQEPPLPLEYNFIHPLLILQRTTVLEQARDQLKNTDYYAHFEDSAK